VVGGLGLREERPEKSQKGSVTRREGGTKEIGVEQWGEGRIEQVFSRKALKV